MFLIFAAILFILWLLGLFLKIASALIHIALVLAIISAVIHFVIGSKKA